MDLLDQQSIKLLNATKIVYNIINITHTQSQNVTTFNNNIERFLFACVTNYHNMFHCCSNDIVPIDEVIKVIKWENRERERQCSRVCQIFQEDPSIQMMMMTLMPKFDRKKEMRSSFFLVRLLVDTRMKRATGGLLADGYGLIHDTITSNFWCKYFVMHLCVFED